MHISNLFATDCSFNKGGVMRVSECESRTINLIHVVIEECERKCNFIRDDSAGFNCTMLYYVKMK